MHEEFIDFLDDMETIAKWLARAVILFCAVGILYLVISL